MSATKFKLGKAVNVEGRSVRAHGFEHDGMFIVNARLSPCGRFYAAPSEFGLTEAEATELARLNADRALMAYWAL